MGKVAKDPPAPRPDLPAAVATGGTPVAAPEVRTASTGTLTYGLRVREVLEVSSFAGARLLAGASGLDRVVQRLNVMEVPDILPWVKPDELLLTTGYPLRNTPQALAELVAELDARGLAALAIKLHRYIEALPPQMLERADRLGFPIIELPDGVGFDDIINQVLTDVLNRQAAVLARSEEVHRALVQIVLVGGGLQEVTDELVGLLGGAVFVTSPEGRVLASSGIPERLAAIRASAFFDADGMLAVAQRPYGLPPGDGAGGAGTGGYAVVPVVAGALECGRIVAFAGRRALGPDDVHTLERAATVAALAITKELAVSAVESKYQGDFLHDLVSGRAGDAAQAVRRAASLGWDIDRPVIVVVAELDPGGDGGTGDPLAEPDQRRLQERFAAAWTSAVRARDRRAAVVGFSQEVVVVLGAPAGTAGDGAVDRMVREIVAQVGGQPALSRRTFSTGVSRPIPTPDGLPAGYEQARRAVTVGRQMQGAGAVADFDGLGVFRLLSLVPDSAELRGFVAETLGELANRDDPDAADLRHTLQVLLETNGNVAETARQLHFHYNTLRYRIGKLERMLGPFTDDPHLRLNLSLALHIVQLRGGLASGRFGIGVSEVGQPNPGSSGSSR